MVKTRTLLLAVAFCAGGIAGAQEATPPEASVPAGSPPQAVVEAPALPAPGDSDAGVAAGAAEAPAATAAPLATAPEAHTDLVSIVTAAHPVVQAVMAVLALAAFVALTVFVQKTAEFAVAGARLRKTGAVLATATDLAETVRALDGQKGPAAEMARAAADELRLTEHDPALLPGTRERTHATLLRIEAGASIGLRAGTGVLASIGSIAPFVGLFGTVFGIMNSFLAIAETKTTNLAVVAPGIAEALLATAIGLAAAIPAVLIYNYLSRRLAAFRHRLADLATVIEALQSRALDRIAARGANVAVLPPARTGIAPARPAAAAGG